MDKIDFSNKASTVVASVVGAALGLLAGPGGALAGHTAGVALASSGVGAALGEILKDVGGRVFSSREKLRVDNATVYIAEGIIEKIKEGHIVRQDGFFEGSNNYSSNGAELLEGILLKCKDQFQERKVRLISNIFENAAFNPLVSAQSAYQALSLADALTYQQLCMLSYLGRKLDFPDFSILSDPPRWYSHVEFSQDTWAVIQDLYEMMNQGVITNIFLSQGPLDVVPGKMELAARGQRAFDLMNLVSIPDADVLISVSPIEYQPIWGKSSNGTINGVYPDKSNA